MFSVLRNFLLSSRLPKSALRGVFPSLFVAASLTVLLTACTRNAGGTDAEDASHPEAPDTSQASEGSGTDAAPSAAPVSFNPANNDRVFYEIFVGSFSDSDGDGTGDLRGIINRMDYLNDGNPDSGESLGIGGIWLTPIFSSPSYHKYDVTDYYRIDPAFGTEEELAELVRLCHERDVKLILDLPINHSASTNEWFLRFGAAHRSGDPSDPYYDYYVYYDPSAGGSAESGHTYASLAGTSLFYECNFSDSMPELHYDNDAVREQMLDIAKHYLALGVDGFRFDAAKYIYYGDHAKSAAFWEWYLGELRAEYPNLYAVAEVWDDDSVTDRYYPAVDCFDFTASQAEGLIASTAQKGDVNRFTAYTESYVNRIKELRQDSRPCFFLANHDTDRAAGYMTVASGYAQVAANLYLLSPGSPFLYYGEEIGLRGSRGAASTDANRRLAMLWGDGDTVTDPEGATYAASNQISETVADQLADENSLLRYYQRLLAIRRANPEIAGGTYTALSLSGTKAGGFVSELNGSRVCVLHNTTGSSQTIDLAGTAAENFSEITASIGAPGSRGGGGAASLDGTVLTIDAQTSVVLR